VTVLRALRIRSRRALSNRSKLILFSVGFLLLYDVGYGSFRCLEKLLEMLKAKGVEVLVDVRAFPRSKIKGFNREELEEELKKNGMEYMWLGDKLGGFRSEGYGKHVQSDDFREGVEVLLSVARNKRVCLMCLERDRRFCHRRFIVEALRKLGVEVRDLVRDQ